MKRMYKYRWIIAGVAGFITSFIISYLVFNEDLNSALRSTIGGAIGGFTALFFLYRYQKKKLNRINKSTSE